MRLRFLPILLCLPLAMTAGARAGAPDVHPEATTTAAQSVDAEVERLATRGQRLLDRGQTQEAIAAFRRAYELRADARFLFDIAECYRQLGLTEQALHFYRRYLSVAPDDAVDRDDVEAEIAELEKQRTTAPALVPSFQNDVVIVPVSPPERPLWKRWWVWTALGVAVVGGAALAFTLRGDNTAVPPTALGDKTFY